MRLAKLVTYLKFFGFMVLGGSLLLFNCSKKKSNDPVAQTPRFLYVASGTCYSGGGNITFTNTTASNLVYRINLSSGQRDMLIVSFM